MQTAQFLAKYAGSTRCLRDRVRHPEQTIKISIANVSSPLSQCRSLATRCTYKRQNITHNYTKESTRKMADTLHVTTNTTNKESELLQPTLPAEVCPCLALVTAMRHIVPSNLATKQGTHFWKRLHKISNLTNKVCLLFEHWSGA